MSEIINENINSDGSYNVKKYDVPVKRFCKILKLRDDTSLIGEYRRMHKKNVIWPEILNGIKKVGILEMEIYIHGNMLVMILDVPRNLEIDTAMKRLASLPRQQEWEDLMSAFQLAEPGSPSDEKWKTMERMFYLYD